MILVQVISFLTLTLIVSYLLRKQYGAVLVGITGSVGTGKSTVAKRLRSLSYSTVDFDLIAKECAMIGTVGWTRIRKAFGSEVLNEDMSLNRKELSKIVFSDETKRKQLQSLLRIPIMRSFLSQTFYQIFIARSRILFLDCPLLFERRLDLLCTESVLVTCNSAIQLRRVMQRDSCEVTAAKQKIASQMPLKAKERFATSCMENNGTEFELSGQIDLWLEHTMERMDGQFWRPTVLSFTAAVVVCALGSACYFVIRWI